MTVILASSSMYRKELLNRLQIPFLTLSPHIDESPLANERPIDLAERLAIEKARVIAEQHPDSVVIGSDQCADLAGEIINKPGNHENAVLQLKKASGNKMVFYTGLAVVSVQQSLAFSCVVETQVKYKVLSEEIIENYLNKEQPYDCAGSGKIESLGIVLVDWIKSDDPSALIGLPLIKTADYLSRCGIKLL
ncbi:MAG: septum formation protein Maf [Betaproteobacteria bacterium]|nr:septum formation protein Maf [Betaproteobacteria bacterium]